MLQYILLSCILLSTIFEGFCQQDRTFAINVPTVNGHGQVISPETFNNTFAVANFKVAPSLLEVRVHLQTAKKHITKECSLYLLTRPEMTKVGISTLRRLQHGNKVVFAVYEETPNVSHRTAKVIALDLDSCNSKNLEIPDLYLDPIIVPSIRGRFDVIIQNAHLCRGFGKRCIIRYNSEFESYTKPVPFDVNFMWSTIHADRSNHVDDNGEIVVRGFDGNTWTYGTVTVDCFSGRKMELQSLSKVSPQMKIVSSGLSFCRVDNTWVDSFVNCSRYNEFGHLVWSFTAKFHIAVTPIAVKTIAENKMLLIVGKSYCKNDEDCWELINAKIDKGEEYGTSGTMHFNCRGSRENLIVFDTNENMMVQYACQNGLGHYFGSIDVLSGMRSFDVITNISL